MYNFSIKNAPYMDKYSFLNAAHTVYFAELYEQYQQDPDSVEPSWRAFFQGYDFGAENYGLSGEVVDGVSTQIPEHVQKEFQVVKLIDGYRTRGHLFTKTNPVRERRKYAPTLEIENFGLNQNDLNTVFNAGEILGIGPATLYEIRKHLEAIYCDSTGIEYMYIRQPEEIQWIQEQYIKLLAEETDMTEKYIKNLISKKVNIYLTAEQAIECGIADEVF